MSAPRLEKLAILLVEDRAEDVELLELALRRANVKFDLHSEASVTGARTALERRRFDVVLTDFSLPDGDGTEVIAASLDLHPEVPVLMISGTLGEDFAVSAMRAGAADYLLKSQFSRVPPAIQRAIEAASLRQERGKALMALEESQKQLASIVESAMDAILTIDESERIVLFNHAAEEVFRCPREQALGKHIEAFIPERFRKDHHSHLTKFGKSGVTRRRMGSLGYVHALRHDGTEFAAEASISQLVRGGVRYFTVILRDVSERIWAEEERRRLTARFLHAQKLEGLGLIAGGIAHDFNNLLTATLCNCETARRAIHEPGEHRDALEHALTGLGQMSALTRQLLAFAGGAAPKLEKVRVQEIARELGDVLRGSLGDRIRLDLSFAQDTPEIEADRSQIVQLLLNLAMNAAQACETRGGRVEISTRRVTIARDAYSELEPGVYCEVTVRDDGCGMNDETRTRIFDPFFSTKPDGKGLGLAAVAGIVKNHGAHVEVDSQPGAGAAFRVFFRSIAPSVRAKSIAKPITAATTDIMVVDDEPLVLEVMTMILENRGFRVAAFESPTSALTAFSDAPEHFDLAIIDLTMPAMDGLEVGTRMRGIRPDLPIVLTSGYSRGTINVPASLANRSTYLEKPFAANDLVNRVRGLLENTLVANA